MITRNKINAMILRNRTVKDFKYQLSEVVRKKMGGFGRGHLYVSDFDETGVECHRSYYNEPVEGFNLSWSFFENQ
jgi:hypothetical protein